MAKKNSGRKGKATAGPGLRAAAPPARSARSPTSSMSMSISPLSPPATTTAAATTTATPAKSTRLQRKAVQSTSAQPGPSRLPPAAQAPPTPRRSSRRHRSISVVSLGDTTTEDQGKAATPISSSRKGKKAAIHTAGTTTTTTTADDWPAGLRWSAAEREEAIALVRDTVEAGMAPTELIRRGVRADVVQSCCRHLCIDWESGTSGGPADTAEGSSAPVVPSSSRADTSSKKESKGSKRKRRKGAVAVGSDGAASAVSNGMQPSTGEPITASNPFDIAEQLRRKVDVERQRAIATRARKSQTQTAPLVFDEAEAAGDVSSELALSQMKLDRLEAERSALQQQAQDAIDVSRSESPSPTSTLSPAMLAMRQAALASMKRKRADEEADSTPLAAPALRQRSAEVMTSGPPPEAPRGPKLQQAPPAAPRYRDMDAPSVEEPVIDWDADDTVAQTIVGGGSGSSSYDPEQLDVRSRSSQAGYATRKPLAYIDDDFHYETSAPAGHVDYSAPLPTLLSAPLHSARTSSPFPSSAHSEGFTQQLLAPASAPSTRFSPMAQHSFISHQHRRTPFLPTQHDHRVLVDLSDEEDSEEEDLPTDARRQRNAQSRLIIAAFKMQHQKDSDADAVMEAENGARSANGSGTPTMHARTLQQPKEDMEAQLQSKEREIAEMKRKLEALDERRRAKAKAVAAAAAKGVAATTGDLTSATMKRTLSDQMPAYISPFARYPGLRRAVLGKAEEQEQSSNGG